MNKQSACTLIGLAGGMLLGGALMLTKKGKEVNQHLNDAFDEFDEKVAKYLPRKNSSPLGIEED